MKFQTPPRCRFQNTSLFNLLFKSIKASITSLNQTETKQTVTKIAPMNQEVGICPHHVPKNAS